MRPSKNSMQPMQPIKQGFIGRHFWNKNASKMCHHKLSQILDSEKKYYPS